MTQKKSIILGSILLAALLVAAVIFYVTTNNVDTPAVANQQTSETSEAPAPADEVTAPEEVAPATVTSTFQGVDAAHWGKGDVQIRQTAAGPVLAFQKNFQVAEGPDLYVYLSANTANQELGEFVSLGTLEATSGAQEYTLPANYASYKTIVIWCKEFSVTFATADIPA